MTRRRAYTKHLSEVVRRKLKQHEITQKELGNEAFSGSENGFRKLQDIMQCKSDTTSWESVLALQKCFERREDPFTDVEIQIFENGDALSLDDESITAHFLHYPGGVARVFHLWGEDTKNIRPRDLVLDYVHSHIYPSVENLPGFMDYIEERKRSTKEFGRVFFNGPNTRLIKWRENPQADNRVALEIPALELKLGPVSWHEYSFLNARGMESRRVRVPVEFLEEIGFQHIARNGDVSKSKLSNILDTATTIVTNDGYAAFSRRSDSVDVSPRYLTASVAENINRYRDDCPPTNPHVALDESFQRQSEPTTDYVPYGRPSPIAAIKRGVGSEISPNVNLENWRNTIRVTGLTFCPDAGHPDLTAMVLVPHSKEQLSKLIIEFPGKERREGTIDYCKISFSDPRTQEILEYKAWGAAGKASLVRVLQIFSGFERDGMGTMDVFNQMYNGTI